MCQDFTLVTAGPQQRPALRTPTPPTVFPLSVFPLSASARIHPNPGVRQPQESPSGEGASR